MSGIFKIMNGIFVSALIAVSLLGLIYASPVYAQATGEVKTITVTGCDSFDFVWIPAGTFEMGSPLSDADHTPAEWPAHKVTISKGFWLGKTEITQDQWESVMKANPSCFKNKNDENAQNSALDDPSGDSQKYYSDRNSCPVENVSPADCDRFIAVLNSKEVGIFRLPSEAEWEYACRAGSASSFYWGDAPDGEYFWYMDNACNKPQAVRMKKPNAWGLYDMSGNISEICADWFESAASRPDGTIDPIGPDKGEYKVVRDGNWSVRSEASRASRRSMMKINDKDMYTGLRLAYRPLK